MAVTAQEQRDAIRLHLEGWSYTKIGAELGMGRNTVSRIVNNSDMSETVVEHKKTYLQTLVDARLAALQKLSDGIADGSIKDPAKAFNSLDQAYERQVKISSGYYLSPEQQKLLVEQWGQIINEEITDSETRKRIAERIAALPAIT